MGTYTYLNHNALNLGWAGLPKLEQSLMRRLLEIEKVSFTYVPDTEESMT
jgi:hypothetical protein